MKRGFFSILFLSFLAALPAQQRNPVIDSIASITAGFMKNGNWTAIYDMTDSSFQQFIKKQAFVQQFTNLQQNAWGVFDSIQYARQQKNYQVYKIYFTEFAGMMMVSINAENKIKGFAIRVYNEPNQDSLIPTNNPLKTIYDLKADSLVRAKIKQSYTVGLSIGVIDSGRISYYGYGETVKGNQQIPSSKTLFEIGSISKTFTAWLLAQEVLKGTIHLDSSINQYLPDSIPALKYKDKSITVQTLSNHTSGMPSLPINFKIIPGYRSADPYATYTQHQLMSYLKTYNPFKEPGKQFQYSNMAVGILGNILELKTGKPYLSLVKERIAVPLNMKYTGLTEKQYASMKQLNTACYLGTGDPASRWHFQAFSAAGVLYSNAEDLLKYAQALFVNSNSSFYKALELTQQPTFTISNTNKIGLGWFLLSEKGKDYIFHSGGTGGYRSMLVIDRKKNRAVIVMTNTANDVSDLALQLIELLNAK